MTNRHHGFWKHSFYSENTKDERMNTGAIDSVGCDLIGRLYIYFTFKYTNYWLFMYSILFSTNTCTSTEYFEDRSASVLFQIINFDF